MRINFLGSEISVDSHSHCDNIYVYHRKMYYNSQMFSHIKNLNSIYFSVLSV